MNQPAVGQSTAELFLSKIVDLLIYTDQTYVFLREIHGFMTQDSGSLATRHLVIHSAQAYHPVCPTNQVCSIPIIYRHELFESTIYIYIQCINIYIYKY